MSTTAVRVVLPTGLVDADGVRLPSGAVISACRATVQRGDESTPVTLALPSPGEPAADADDLARWAAEASGAAVVAQLEADGQGHATVTAPAAAEGHVEAIALAAAVCAASWGWDESPAIHVTVNGHPMDIAPVYRDGAWYATRMPASGGPWLGERPSR